jgi:hypothetical protein
MTFSNRPRVIRPRGRLARVWGGATTRRSIGDPLGSEGLTWDPCRWAEGGMGPAPLGRRRCMGSSADTSARYARTSEGLVEPFKRSSRKSSSWVENRGPIRRASAEAAYE